MGVAILFFPFAATTGIVQGFLYQFRESPLPSWSPLKTTTPTYHKKRLLPPRNDQRARVPEPDGQQAQFRRHVFFFSLLLHLTLVVTSSRGKLLEIAKTPFASPRASCPCPTSTATAAQALLKSMRVLLVEFKRESKQSGGGFFETEPDSRERERERARSGDASEKESDDENETRGLQFFFLQKKKKEKTTTFSRQKRRPQPQRRSRGPRRGSRPFRHSDVRLVPQTPQDHGRPPDPAPADDEPRRRKARRQRALLREALGGDPVLDPADPVSRHERVGEARLLPRPRGKRARRKGRDGAPCARDAGIDQFCVAKTRFASFNVSTRALDEHVVREREEGRGAVVVARDAALLLLLFLMFLMLLLFLLFRVGG